jgi:hypothetical protein
MYVSASTYKPHCDGCWLDLDSIRQSRMPHRADENKLRDESRYADTPLPL